MPNSIFEHQMAWNRRSTTFPIHFTITCVNKRSTNFTTTFSDRLIMHWTVWEVSVHAQEFLWSASRSAQQIIESKTQREIHWESQGVIIPGFFCPCSATNCGFWHCSNGCFLSHGGTPKSSILIGLSIINHPFLGYRLFWKPPNLNVLSDLCHVVIDVRESHLNSYPRWHRLGVEPQNRVPQYHSFPHWKPPILDDGISHSKKLQLRQVYLGLNQIHLWICDICRVKVERWWLEKHLPL